jgi:effector-binding domain-containing protein
MISPCEVIQMSAQPVLCVRTHTSMQGLPTAIQQAYQQIFTHLQALNEQPAGPVYVAYFNLDLHDMEVEMGAPVSKDLPGSGEVQPGHLPDTRAATCTYTGPYNEIELAYNELTGWASVSGYEPTGVAYEFYLNDPAVTSPLELQTRIVFPLK